MYLKQLVVADIQRLVLRSKGRWFKSFPSAPETAFLV